ncbi:hypothetical protein P171DRAFT_159506 [Karstenula rhodostoma CBS 690.94]|uniref:Uncharacterized protein n=1 Tax=Karstenula rhodostoma CBS 690.94 TaxID=1392251 RepID=A0A9P4P7Y8_9PLEO|nr:hypothetical protein P171DRAFT_159506 [Karstenula rhodostoma CBS 690.94]
MALRNLTSHHVGVEDAQPPQSTDKRAGRTAVQQQKSSATPVAAQKDIPYSIQVSQTRRKPACPYHIPIIDLNIHHTSKNEMSPMERFLSASYSEHPVALSEGLRVGTAASGGCTCGRAPKRQCTAML